MLGGLSIWTSSFSKRKMNYSWTATLFFLSGIENGEGQWNINNPLYIWAHDTFCVLPWYAQNKRPISQFLKAAQDHFHFLLSEELEEITLWVYHSLTTLYQSSSTRLLTITCVFVLVAFNCFSVFILCWWTLAQSCEDLASIRAAVLQSCFYNC